jgi:uncharacterized protein YbaP (TraB family)
MAQRPRILPKLLNRNTLDVLRSRARIATALILLAVFASAAHAAERFGEGLLWRIDGKGGQANHVFGTIHLADPRVTTLPPAVAREFKQARTLTIEAGAGSSNLATLANRMIYTDGRDLPGVAGDALYKRVAALSIGLGLPEAAVRIFKPWAMTLLLSAPQQDPMKVLDYVLARMAQEQGKPVMELESLDEQVSVFDGMSEADQVALLQHAVANYERLPQIIERLIAVYLKRDLAAMWRISDESVGEDMKRIKDIFVQRLIVDRNTRMVERMEESLRQGGAFVAVGSLHLYGDRGVLAQLERRGWKVTRVY